MSTLLLLEPVSALVATDPPLVTGGSVISVPPWPSEVTLKFPEVYEPTRVNDWVWVPSLTVKTPLAVAPEVFCVHDTVLLPEM
jgi:hypothetical protein